MKTYNVSSKGVITIPASIRKKYNLKPGIKIEFIEKDNRIIMKIQDNKKK